MLVGVLALVIIIAVIWDRQSSDLARTVSVGNAKRGMPGGPSPALSDSASKAEGIIKLARATPARTEEDPVLAALQEEFPRSHVPSVDLHRAAAGDNHVLAPVAEAQKVKTYIVQEGESFWTIARDKYGDSSLWPKLHEANKERFPRAVDLRVGATIILPELKRDKVSLPREPVTGSTTGPDGKRYYMVKEGDYLGLISQKFYGTCKKWQLILDANDLVDERSLRAGMKIVIPRGKK
jgi:nucleoid-associated protein YgaU